MNQLSIAEKIDERIKERTGLITKNAIEAYDYFCMNANLSDGIIMYDGVKHNFYQKLFAQASEPMQVLEIAYYTSIGNHEDIPFGVNERQFKSPLSVKAGELYSKYLKLFMRKHLVGISSKEYNGVRYPVLRGYNYFNDTKFYKKVDTKTSQGRELKV
jgi:hypothetical protein